MIGPELTARIRRLHFAERWPVGTIASQLGLHHDAVERAIAQGPMGPPRPVPPSVVDPYKPFIQDTLKQYPRLLAKRVFDMVKSRGYPGSYVTLRRYVRMARPVSQAEAYLRRNTLPGEEGQVDWGCFGKLAIGNAQRNLSCFVLVLSWSRAVFARFFLDQTMESFLAGHVEGFKALGGVPRGILYDNLKSAVLERDGDAIRFHPRLLELAGHYHFAPRPCAPARGNEKGRVERTIRYLRDSFFAARRFTSLADLNAQLVTWTAEVAHTRAVPGDATGRLVHQALEEERPRLLPLPEHPFPTDVVRPVASGKTPYIRFDGNDYSIPHTLVKKPLTLVASETRLRILDGTAEVAAHDRCWDKGRTLEVAAHLEALAKAKRAAHELRGRDLLRQQCGHAEAFLEALARRDVSLSHQTAHLLKLLSRYGAGELNAALADALARGAVGATSVAHLLDQQRRRKNAPPPLEVLLPERAGVRDVTVTPHPLSDYDKLLEEKPS